MTPWQMDSLYYCLYFDDFPKKGGISLMASKTDAIKSSCPAVGTTLRPLGHVRKSSPKYFPKGLSHVAGNDICEHDPRRKINPTIRAFLNSFVNPQQCDDCGLASAKLLLWLFSKSAETFVFVTLISSKRSFRKDLPL